MKTLGSVFLVVFLSCGLLSVHGFRFISMPLAAQPRADRLNAIPRLPVRARGLRATRLLATLDDVKDVVASQLGVDKEKVVVEANFIQDLGADSLDSVELVMALEEKFGITIPDEDATKIKTVQDAVAYIEQAKSK